MIFRKRQVPRLFSFFPRLRLDQYLGLFFVGFVLLTLPFFWRNQQLSRLTEPEFNLVQIGAIPLLKANPAITKTDLLAKISAKNILAIDVDSATVLLEKNATQSVSPASTTKMMTAIIAQENLAPDQILMVNKNHLVNGNKIGFVVGEKVSVEDLLHALLIGSNNEAAEILTSGFEGGEEEFVNLMNQKARELRLEKTLFINPAGFDDENIYSTARDLGVLARELMKVDDLRQIVATKEFTFFDIDQKFEHKVINTNRLLHQNEEVVGIKTGTTDEAGEVLVTQVEREMVCDNECEPECSATPQTTCTRKILIVLMGSQNRYEETTQVIDWIFDSYSWVNLNLADFLWDRK